MPAMKDSKAGSRKVDSKESFWSLALWSDQTMSWFGGVLWFSKVNCIMRKELEGNIRQSTEKLGLGQYWTF